MDENTKAQFAEVLSELNRRIIRGISKSQILAVFTEEGVSYYEANVSAAEHDDEDAILSAMNPCVKVSAVVCMYVG